jgi:hypothetical protein
MKNAALYVRVSTDKQAEKYGPAYQESELRDWADANGSRVVEVVYDAAYGRSELNRPGLDREGLEEDAAIILGMNAGRLAHMVSAPPEFRRDIYRRLGLTFRLSEDGVLEVDGHLDRNWLPDYDELYNGFNTTEYILPTAPFAEP